MNYRVFPSKGDHGWIRSSCQTHDVYGIWEGKGMKGVSERMRERERESLKRRRRKLERRRRKERKWSEEGRGQAKRGERIEKEERERK